MKRNLPNDELTDRDGLFCLLHVRQRLTNDVSFYLIRCYEW